MFLGLEPYESSALIPMMIFTPTIINDGKKLFISSQHISYMVQNQVQPNMKKHNIIEGVEFRRFFKAQEADSLQFTSALRMSATFPFISPVVSMPSMPVMDVVDAGGHRHRGDHRNVPAIGEGVDDLRVHNNFEQRVLPTSFLQ